MEGSIFAINKDMTIQVYFQNVKAQLDSMRTLSEEVKCSIFEFASKLIDTINIEGNIVYSRRLTKRIA